MVPWLYITLWYKEGSWKFVTSTYTAAGNVWTDLVGVNAVGNTITKTEGNGWGNSGAASIGTITADGKVNFRADETNTYRMCDLSSSNTDAHYATINYALLLTSRGTIQTYESGVYKGSFGNYMVSDRFSIERVGSAILYKKMTLYFTPAPKQAMAV
ncbi:MAG: hypothetical protein QM500_08950 [Methylococcales bacterium]